MRGRYLLLLALLLTSCAAPTASPASATRTVTPIPPVHTSTATATSRPTSVPTETSTALPAGFQWTQDTPVSSCIPVQATLLAGLNLPWLVLGESRRIATVYIVDPDNGNVGKVLVPTGGMYTYDVSPNGKWLAYEWRGPERPSPITVEPVGNLLTGSSQGSLIWHPSEEYNYFVGWLGNDTINLSFDPERWGKTLVRNPFTGVEHTFSMEQIPNFENIALDRLSSYYLFGESDLLPDPTLTRFIYPASDDEDEKGDEKNVSLWDLKNKKALGNRLAMSLLDVPPGWSLSGSDFIAQGSSPEWFQMTRDGNVRQLTHFSDYLANFHLGHAGRSWDGRYLAFAASYDLDPDGKYLVMDLKASTPEGFCIGADFQDGPFLTTQIWSPDSKYLILSNAQLDVPGGNWILVDVEKRKAYQLINDVAFGPVGWMAVDGPLPSTTPPP